MALNSQSSAEIKGMHHQRLVYHLISNECLLTLLELQKRMRELKKVGDIKKANEETGEVPLRFRALAALSEVASSIPDYHVAAHSPL